MFLTSACDEKFRNWQGQYICQSCRTQLYKKKDHLITVSNVAEKRMDKTTEEVDTQEKEEDMDIDVSSKDPDYKCQKIDKEIKRIKLVSVLEKAVMESPDGKLDFNLLENNEEFIRKSIISPNSSLNNEENHDNWIADLKSALLQAANRKEKIFLLTTMPVEWSIRRTAKEFSVSKHVVIMARKLKKENGYGTYPDKKKGNSMNIDIINKVRDFFLSDNVSRVMPGMKDYKSVIVNGKRRHETVI